MTSAQNSEGGLYTGRWGKATQGQRGSSRTGRVPGSNRTHRSNFVHERLSFGRRPAPRKRTRAAGRGSLAMG